MPVEWVLIIKGLAVLLKSKHLAYLVPKIAMYAKAHGAVQTANLIGLTIITVGGIAWTTEKIESLGYCYKALDKGDIPTALKHATALSALPSWKEGVTPLGSIVQQFMKEHGRNPQTVIKLIGVGTDLFKTLDFRLARKAEVPPSPSANVSLPTKRLKGICSSCEDKKPDRKTDCCEERLCLKCVRKALDISYKGKIHFYCPTSTCPEEGLRSRFGCSG